MRALARPDDPLTPVRLGLIAIAVPLVAGIALFLLVRYAVWDVMWPGPLDTPSRILSLHFAIRALGFIWPAALVVIPTMTLTLAIQPERAPAWSMAYAGLACTAVPSRSP